MQFVVFHGAWDKNQIEGPYNPGSPPGIDTFLRALDDHQVPQHSNVWVDLGTVWREVLRSPTVAAHAVGKLLKRVGVGRVLWGTDAVWYGSPQAQIAAFRAFNISQEFQDRFGYPALTDSVKAKVFGLNAAKLFRYRRDCDPLRARSRTRSPVRSSPRRTSEPRDGCRPRRDRTGR